ncbi:MAG: cytochrome c family protein [Chloroflexi bacterium]|nr:cytochrome c family protein [Chloroflexota bacterium]
MLVNYDEFSQNVHGQQPCMDCHGGVQSSDKDTAHEGLIARPSDGPATACSDCHPDVAEHYPSALHASQQGYFTRMYKRSVPENHAALDTMFGNHCASCHTTCGDCHISQPMSVGGGFFNGHLIEKTPPMTRSCTACHGSRVGKEYLGKHEDIPGDVHFREGRMNCVNCHGSAELHGEPAACDSCHPGPQPEAAEGEQPAEVHMPADHRYAGYQTPSCETCHARATTGTDGVAMHAEHGADLSCQVCHSITYTSCDGCHVAISDKSSNPFFETRNTYFTFLIGRNAQRSYDRPYVYVPVRHIPIDRDSYSFYGEDLLPNYDAIPTWAYATPHNIQLKTPQTKSCNACHGNAALFLTADKVAPDELKANLDVIVETIPEIVEEPVQATDAP